MMSDGRGSMSCNKRRKLEIDNTEEAQDSILHAFFDYIMLDVVGARIMDWCSTQDVYLKHCLLCTIAGTSESRKSHDRLPPS